MSMRSLKYNLLIYTKAERCRIMHASSAMYIRLLAPKTSVELSKKASVKIEKQEDTANSVNPGVSHVFAEVRGCGRLRNAQLSL
jgi:hypothetical protein